MPTEIALIATALVESGRHALAVHDGKEYSWPDDQADLASALVSDVQAAHELSEEEPEPKKKTSRAKTAKAPEEEKIINLTIQVKPNQAAGEMHLSDQKKLKTLLSHILAEGVEFLYSPTDIGWQWSLERVNWSTLSGGELARFVTVTPEFTDNSVGVELGPGGKKRTRPRRKTT